MVVRKVISMLSEGIRDGAAARAASDYLFIERKGKVSSTLNIFSVDLQTRTLVITRNNPAPVMISYGIDRIRVLSEECGPIGLYRDTRPWISEVPLEAGMTAIMYTDGLVHAGSRQGENMDLVASLQCLVEENLSAQTIADALLEQAYKLDHKRPVDDTSVVVLTVTHQAKDNMRRMSVRLPLDIELE